jgi:outer membrane autotransporter protein
VINKGTITVATTATNITAFFGGVNASAIGIQTGAGNDTIVNQGTITATTIVNGVSSRGTAINAGAGDDMVKLTNGSVTNGNIDLGSGNNQLVLEGTPVISGTVLDGSSGLALVFNAAGSFGGALPGVSATKNGPGTFTLPTLNRMQRIEVNQGTLKIDSDYAFLGEGTFQAKVNGNGSYGQFTVNGKAALDGTMKIVRGSGAYVDGTAFDVLTASKGIEPGTAFSRVESPDDTRLLKFHTEQLSEGVRVKADVASFTAAAGTPNQMAVARSLDRVLPRSSGDLNLLLGKIQALGDGQFASAFATMSPAVYAGYSASTLNSVQQYTNVLQDRMAALRAADLWPGQTAGASSGEPVRLAYTGKGLSDLLEASEAESARSSGLWLRGFSQKGNQNATEDAGGFDYRLAGTTIGWDHRWRNGFSAGVSLGAVRNTVNVDSDVSQGDIDSTMGSIYAGYFDRRWYVNGVLSAGSNKYDTHRTNTLDQSTITSTHGGDVRSAAAGVGGYVPLEAWWLEPFATVQFTRLKEEGFSETGSGALDVPARTTEGVFSTLGARFSRPIRDGNGAAWVPQASLAWLHDYSKNQVLSASYIGAPDSIFSIEGQPVQRNGALVELGISYRSKGGLTSMFEYIGEFRDQFRAHTLAGELRWEY